MELVLESVECVEGLSIEGDGGVCGMGCLVSLSGVFFPTAGRCPSPLVATSFSCSHRVPRDRLPHRNRMGSMFWVAEGRVKSGQNQLFLRH